MNECRRLVNVLACGLVFLLSSMMCSPAWAQTRPSLASLQGQVDKLLKGLAPPCSNMGSTIHFADCGNGTVTDVASGLVWLKLTSCNFDQSHDNSMKTAAALKDGVCGLTDNSLPGDWRIPTKAELQALFKSIADDCSYLSLNCAGNINSPYYSSQWFPFIAKWTDGSNLAVQQFPYWVRESAALPCCGEVGYIHGSKFVFVELNGNPQFVWPVRAR
jgi:hypothetical protein